MLEAVRLVRARAEPGPAVVGFCGGPFTVAGYLVEGRPSRELPRTKALMLAEPETVGRADGEARGDVRAATWPRRSRAGADVIQLFDSWVGALSPSITTASTSRRGARAILAAVDVPTIHFGTGATAPARGAGRRRRRRDRARLATAASTTGWARVAGPGGAGQPRPGRAARPVGRRRARGARRAAAGRTAGPGTSSTSATASCPEPTRTTLTRLAALVHERTRRRWRLRARP